MREQERWKIESAGSAGGPVKITARDRCKEPAISVKGEVIDLWYSGKGAHPRRQHPGGDRPGNDACNLIEISSDTLQIKAN